MLTAEHRQPAIGAHVDMDAADYHALKYCSASNLKAFRRTPLHAWEQMHGPRKESTPAMRFGTAVHHAVLEPRIFRDRYSVADQCCATTGKGSRCSNLGRVMHHGGKWYCGTHDPKNGLEAAVAVLAPDDFDKALRIADAVLKHPAAAAVMAMKIHTEFTRIWRDSATDVLSKGRMDLVCEQGIIGDLKTTEDASREAFERSIFDYGYWIQAPWYIDAMGACDFVVIAVEKEAPFAVAVYRILDDVIDLGREEIARLMPRWAECERSGKWPGYSTEPEDVGIPAWAEKRLERVG